VSIIVFFKISAMTNLILKEVFVIFLAWLKVLSQAENHDVIAG